MKATDKQKRIQTMNYVQYKERPNSPNFQEIRERNSNKIANRLSSTKIIRNNKSLQIMILK